MRVPDYRNVVDFSGYRVGDDGSVWTRWVSLGGNQKAVLGGIWKRLNPGPNDKGYLRVVLSRESRKYQKFVHRLVLEAFIGECPEGLEARHGDAGKLDNTLSNLRYGTHQENIEDNVRRGTLGGAKGERHAKAKLTDDLVREIRSEYATGGTSYGKLGKKHQVTSGVILKVIRRITWTHVA